MNKNTPSIVTIGFSPAWDIACYGKDLEWGGHDQIDRQTIVPAGKALNVSKALFWMGRESTAAGLWGDGDYQQMRKAVESLWPLITVKTTIVAGSTRCNITVIDTEKRMEMHLRSRSELARPETMERLNADLKDFVGEDCICVFSGAMPENELLTDAIEIMKSCHEAGGRIVLDTSGPASKEIISTGLVWLAKPNVSELGEISGVRLEDSPADLVEAGRKLLKKTELVLISRGHKGAVLVGSEAALKGRCTRREEVLSTVGCGDYLLAGFLSTVKDTPHFDLALETALKAASAKAWGWTEDIEWQQAETDIEVEISRAEQTALSPVRHCEQVMDQTLSRPGIIVFGAGAAGKGLVGLLFSRAGYKVTFVDIKDNLVEQLGDAGRYQVLIHNLDGSQEECSVEGFRVIHARDRQTIAREMIHADLVLTAVFPQNLPDVAKTIALGVNQCRTAGRSDPINCIACENMKKSSSTLGGQVHTLLSGDDRRYCDEIFGFADCMINRVVPNPSRLLYVETEDYCEWTVHAAAIKGVMPIPLPFIEFVDHQSARLDRKLMVYNGSHAACAYFGFARGHTWIHESAADEQVVPLVRGTIDELGEVVQCLHGFSRENIEAYKRDFWLRCRNRGLRDEVVRIARQPKRKLGRSERLIGPAKLAQQYRLPHSFIMQAILAALEFRHPDDPESLDLAEQLRHNGMRATLSKISGLELDDPLLDELEAVAPD